MSSRGYQAPLFLILALALLFPIGASLPLACCAGVAPGGHGTAAATESHCGGGTCFDRAASDALARHCCQGGDSFERPQPAPQPVPDAALAQLAAPAPSLAEAFASLGSPRDPVPRLEPLYTLHSSLLI